MTALGNAVRASIADCRAAARQLAVVCAVLGGLVLCGRSAAADFTDSVGRHVVLPEKIERVVPAGPPADALLLALAPDKLVGLVEPFGARKKPYLPQAVRELRGIPRVTRKVGQAEIEAVKKLRGDVIVDYGDIAPAYVETADRISATTGTPYIVVSGYIADTPAAARTVGRILGREKRGEAAANAAEGVLERLKPVSALPADKRITVYYARGADGLKATRPGSTVAEAIEFAGGRNVVPTGTGAFVQMTVEGVKALAPAVVVVADPKAAATDAPIRATLPVATVFLVDRGMPFHWLDEPPSLNRLIGALWLASKLHPTAVSFDTGDAKRLSEALLGLQLSDEQLAAMMK